MKIEVELRGPLTKYGTGKGPFIHYPAKSPLTVRELLEELAVPVSSVSFVSITGHKVDLDTNLKGGEELVVYPRVAGG